MGSTDLALSWKDHHGVLFNVFEHLLAKKSLVDCTLAAEGKFLKAHRIVLSACSPYFEALFDQEYDKHPIIFLRDVQFEDLKTLLEFVYSGEIKIPESRLVEFLNVAEALQIKGLGGAGNDGQGSTKKTCFEALRQRETSSPVPRKRSRRPSNSSDSNSRDRAEIIPINSETSRLQSSGESQVPVASSSSVPQPAPPAKQTVPSEEISVDVTKVKEEVEHTSQSACSEQVSSDPDQAEGNEEILGLKPEFAQVTFTEDYSDDMMPEDSDSVKPVMDQDQPCSSRQYPGFSTEPVNPGELGMHGSYGVGGADQPVPEGYGGASQMESVQAGGLRQSSWRRGPRGVSTQAVGVKSVDCDDGNTAAFPKSKQFDYQEGMYQKREGTDNERTILIDLVDDRTGESVNSNWHERSECTEEAYNLESERNVPYDLAKSKGDILMAESHSPAESFEHNYEGIKNVDKAVGVRHSVPFGSSREMSRTCSTGTSETETGMQGIERIRGHMKQQCSTNLGNVSSSRDFNLYLGTSDPANIASEPFESNPYSCQKCLRVCASRQVLRRHMLLHTGERPFACSFCPKTFRQNGNLRKHLVIHTGERPFQCSECGQRFTQSNSLQYHVRAKHTGERPFKCEFCARTFVVSTGLRLHMEQHKCN